MSDPAIRKALEAAERALFDAPMPDGDPLGVLIHLSDYTDEGMPVEKQILAAKAMCGPLAAAAVAAFLRALPAGWHMDKTREDIAAAVEAAAKEPPHA